MEEIINRTFYYQHPISKDRGWVIIVLLIPKNLLGNLAGRGISKQYKILGFYDALANCITDQLSPRVKP